MSLTITRRVMSSAATSSNHPSDRHLALAQKACAFLSASTDPFHAVSNAVTKLQELGFTPLQSSSGGPLPIEKGGKYYYTVHHSTLVAFTVGKNYQAGNGFHILAGHTDSPNLKVKPKSRKPAKNGVQQIGVECYGGGLWHTWFDRDLSISGKVLVRSSTSSSSEVDDTGNKNNNNNKIRSKLVQLRDPVARVSTLCIHLQSADERQAFAVNKEEHTSPIIAQEQPKQQQGPEVSSSSTSSSNAQLEQEAESQLNSLNDWHKGQEPLLLQRIASQLGVDVTQIADFDLSLYDTQPATLGGMNREFLYSARLDNLATVFCGVEALMEYSKQQQQQSMGEDDDANVSMIVCFDHEEVGSVSTHGAGSPVLKTAVERVAHALGVDNIDLKAATLSNSFVLSVDQAHAIHPNYASKHESQHAPLMNHGVVIKTNSNQRYTTNSLTGFLVRELARKANVPIQEFCVRNDCPCGTTIGPTISALTGIRTVDLGMPQLSMHSCREVMGTVDLTHGVDLFTTFFKSFKEVNDSIQG